MSNTLSASIPGIFSVVGEESKALHFGNTPEIEMLGWRALSMLLLLCSGVPVVAAADAEYALRWDPASGGPATAAAALSLLAPGEPDEDRFEVRYAVLTPLPAAGDVKVILRQRHRTSKPRHELTYKIRSSTRLPAEPTLAIGHCPAGAGADSPGDEVDVAFTAGHEPVRAFSRSCTVESKTGPPAVPAALNAKFAPCQSQMTRLKRDGLKVEEWHLPGGRIAIEVSKTGPDTTTELESFRRNVVDPLVMIHKVRPLRASKTEMGSDCGA